MLSVLVVVELSSGTLVFSVIRNVIFAILLKKIIKNHKTLQKDSYTEETPTTITNRINFHVKSKFPLHSNFSKGEVTHNFRFGKNKYVKYNLGIKK